MSPAIVRRPPLGVIVVAALLMVQAVIRAFFGIIGIVLFFLPGWSTLGTGAHLVAGIIGVLALAVAIGFAVLAWGLLSLRPWAFLTTVILEGVNLILGIIELTQPHPSPGAIIGGILLPALILIYFLLDTHVRAAFGV